MFCKYCGKELEEDQTVCANCGRDNADPVIPAESAETQSVQNPELPEKPKKKKTALKIVLSVTAIILLAAMLASVLYIGTTGKTFSDMAHSITNMFKPKENNIHYKDSYTVPDKKVDSKRDDVVATMGDHTLTNSQLQVFYWMQVIDFLNYTGGYASYYGLDIQKPLNEQMFDEEKGLTWEKYFIEAALNSWHRYSSLVIEAEKNGFKMSEEDEKHLEEAKKALEEDAKKGKYESVDAMLADQMGKNVTRDDYVNYLNLYYTGNLYFADLIEKTETSQEEIDAYFEAHAEELKKGNPSITKESGLLIDVRHILIQPEGGKTVEDDKGNKKTEYSEAEWEACRVQAQKIYDEWLSGEKTEDSFAELAKKYSKDENASSGGIYNNVNKGSMVKEYDDWCFDPARKTGDHGLVKTQFGYHIMYFVGGEEGWIRASREGVVNEKASKLLVSYGEQNPIEVTYKAIGLAAPNFSK